MKILLVGEFSGVHNNLKKGLIALGHDVTLAADGDGYRRFKYDFKLTPFRGRILGKIFNTIYILINIKKYIGYDIVQYLNPVHFPYYLHFIGVTRLLFFCNKKSVYYICGTDPAFLSSLNQFKYSPFDDSSSEKPNYNKLYLRYYRWFIKNIDIIVPSMYTYWLGYRQNPKISSPIPLPAFAIEDYKIRKTKNIIHIMHGVTRKYFKGSQFIISALERIKENYHSRVVITIVEKLAFEEYLHLLPQCDILIDQCKSYDYGMNGIIGLQHGCIVLSGAEEIAMKYLGFHNQPIINILPDEGDIYKKLESLIRMGNYDLDRMRKESRSFVANNHDYRKSSRMFELLYFKILNQ